MCNHMQSIIILIAALSLMGCIDQIDLDVPSGEGENSDVVVNGKLVFGNPSLLTVTIGEVFDFDGNPNRITVQNVELIDSDGNSSSIAKIEDGSYEQEFLNTDSDMIISPSKTYMIEILLANGELIQSNFQDLSRVPRNSSIREERG